MSQTPKSSVHSSAWGASQTRFFYQLTPDRILDAVEGAYKVSCSGRFLQLNSMENRVYDIELVDGPQAAVVAKFYRPGRWSAEQIQDEHRYLLDLAENEIPAVAPIAMPNGETLGKLSEEEIYFAIFPKVGGRSPDELPQGDVEQIGRLIARMHNVGASKKAAHRITLTAHTYGWESLEFLSGLSLIPEQYREPCKEVMAEICRQSEPLLENLELHRIHGDCHLGNLLYGRQGYFWVDFDDMLVGPAVQDLWLMVPSRDHYGRGLLSCLLAGYEQMRPFDRNGLRAIEALRALRMVHFSAWVGRRWEDPAFQKAFPAYDSEQYWRQHLIDLQQQLTFVKQPNLWDGV